LGKLCFGTWQISPMFNKVNYEEAKKIILYAREKGIDQYDTALAYGDGFSEKVLGETIGKDDFIITKIPAKRIVKPYEKITMDYAYDEETILESVKQSIKNLKREPNVMLLHNWSNYWEDTLISARIFEYLNDLKKQGMFEYVGVSLPNNYGEHDMKYLGKMCDYIEAPYNANNQWIAENIDQLRSYGTKVIIRSIFDRGRVFESLQEDQKSDYVKKAIAKSLEYGDLITIGMTSIDKINDNIHYFNANFPNFLCELP